MKKLLPLVLAIVFGLSTATGVALAAEKGASAQGKKMSMKVLRGQITAVNAAANQVTVQKERTKETVTVTVPATETPNLKEGMHVKISLKSGTTDQAETIKVMVPKVAKNKK